MNQYAFTAEEIESHQLQDVIPTPDALAVSLQQAKENLDTIMATLATQQQPGGPPCQCLVQELCNEV
jgi:hypothetical protein